MKNFVLLFVFTAVALPSFAQSSKIQQLIKCEHGNLAVEAGQYADALKTFEECLQKGDSLPEAQLGAARAAWLGGDLKKGKKYVTEALNTSNAQFKTSPDYKAALRVAALIDEEERAAIDMIRVKGGAYVKGCKADRDVNCESQESPAHSVRVDDFYIAKYELTQAQWQKVMGTNPSGFAGCNECPVENVSWDTIQVFIAKLNSLYPGMSFRLPTEAEWEFAARGGTKSKGYKYCGSDEANDVAWFDANSGNKTHPVGTKAPNELGLYDMGGNVWEWCSDWFGLYSDRDEINPKGLLTATHRSDCGGCWQYSVKYVSPSTRGGLNPYEANNDLGFRLARSVQPVK